MKRWRWQEVSQDPTSLAVLQIRRNEVLAAESNQLIHDRISYLCHLATNKDVLDVGIVEHTIDAIKSNTWLHRHICQASKSCLGVDILEEGIEYLKTLGFNVAYLDITQEALEQKFDLIICGEVLEHLESPGSLFKNSSQMLKPGGKLVISVPNPWYAGVVLKSIFKGFYYLDNIDHIAWFDPFTLCELAQRYGLVLDCFHGISVAQNSQMSFKAKVFFNLMSLFQLLGVRGEFFTKSISYEFVLSD